MKNKKLISLLAASACILSSCGAADNSSSKGAEPVVEVKNTAESLSDENQESFSDSDSKQITEANLKEDESKIDIEVIPAYIDIIYRTYDELIEDADIIMIGEYLDDGEVKMDYGDPINKKYISNERTYNTIKALKVFKGEDKIGEDSTVRIAAGYALTTDNIDDGRLQLLLNGELVPMYKGGKAIFVLRYFSGWNAYAPCDSQGRFPLPEDLGKTDKYGFKNGLAPGVSFQSGIYSRLCSEYGIK